MTKHKHADVICAWANGETIQYYLMNQWSDYEGTNTPDFNSVQWRVKPKSVTVWVNIYTDGLLSTWPTKDEADKWAMRDRAACVPLTYTEGEGL